MQFKSPGEARHSLLTNVSRGGVFIYTETPAPIGTRLDIEITIDESGTTLLVPAKVVSQDGGADMISRVKGMGCSFLDMDDETRKQVDELYSKALEQADTVEEPAKAPSDKRAQEKRGAA